MLKNRIIQIAANELLEALTQKLKSANDCIFRIILKDFSFIKYFPFIVFL